RGGGLGVGGREATPGKAGLAAAGGAAAEVVAGDPQPGAGEQHVARPVPARPAVRAGGAWGVADQRPARRSRRQARQAGGRYCARAGLVALVLVVEPAVVAADIHRAGVGDRGVQRVTAVVSDPVGENPALRRRERRRRVAQADPRERTGPEDGLYTGVS